MKAIKEFKNIIIIGLVILGYLGITNYQDYQAGRIEKERQTQEAFQAQQRALEDAQQAIDTLKDENNQAKDNQKSLEQKLNTQLNQPTNNKIDLQAVIKHWHPVVVNIVCGFDYNNGKVTYKSGSGTLRRYEAKIQVVTNKHVLVAEGFNGPKVCVVVPFDKTYTVVNDGTSNIRGRSDVDFGGIDISDASQYLQNLPLLNDEGIKACTNTPDLGSPVAVLGYPSIGSQTDITITQGIISAYEKNYYITDAKIEYGNSGGAAIDIEKNCYLGIPTWVETGAIESLGRILNWQSI